MSNEQVNRQQSLTDFFARGIQHVKVMEDPANPGYRVYIPNPDQQDGPIAMNDEENPMALEIDLARVVQNQEVEGLTFASADVVERRITDLKEWWVRDAGERAEMVAAKAVTYGSDSLIELGRTLAKMQGRFDIPNDEAQELAIWSYLVGKLGRWTDAVLRGERVQADTITDIIAYGTMAARIRQSGGWPDSHR